MEHRADIMKHHAHNLKRLTSAAAEAWTKQENEKNPIYKAGLANEAYGYLAERKSVYARKSSAQYEWEAARRAYYPQVTLWSTNTDTSSLAGTRRPDLMKIKTNDDGQPEVSFKDYKTRQFDPEQQRATLRLLNDPTTWVGIGTAEPVHLANLGKVKRYKLQTKEDNLNEVRAVNLAPDARQGVATLLGEARRSERNGGVQLRIKSGFVGKGAGGPSSVPPWTFAVIPNPHRNAEILQIHHAIRSLIKQADPPSPDRSTGSTSTSPSGRKRP